jgi:hypothetical protein
MTIAHCWMDNNGMSNDDNNNNKISVPLYIYYREKSFTDQYLHRITSSYANKQTRTCSIDEKRIKEHTWMFSNLLPDLISVPLYQRGQK